MWNRFLDVFWMVLISLETCSLTACVCHSFLKLCRHQQHQRQRVHQDSALHGGVMLPVGFYWRDANEMHQCGHYVVCVCSGIKL